MARLRKPSPQTLSAPASTFAKPGLEAENEVERRRVSPRKLCRVRVDEEECGEEGECENSVVFVPKSRGGISTSLGKGEDETPKARKARVLKPLGGNSVLFSSLGTDVPREKGRKSREKLGKDGCEGLDMRTGSRVRRGVAGEMKIKKIDVVVQESEQSEVKKTRDAEVLEEGIEEGETSILCDDEEGSGEEEDSVEQDEDIDEEVEEEDDDDEDPVVVTRPRQPQRHVRRVDSESESDYESGSSSESDVPGVRDAQKPKALSVLKAQPSTGHEQNQNLTSLRPAFRKNHSTVSNWAQEVIDLTSSPEPPPSFVLPPPKRIQETFKVPSRPQTSESNAPFAILSYSPTPPRLRSPNKAPPLSRPLTPPPVPQSPSKLVSPSKKKAPPPQRTDLRPSLDAFWEPDAVHPNGGSDDVGKPLVSPRKMKWREDIVKMMEGVALEDDSDVNSDASFPSPTTSPRKKSAGPNKNQRPPRSPTKRSTPDTPVGSSVKQIRAQRKAFADSKHALATSFITELDNTICSGQIAALAAPTGGIKLVWSKTLKTTAGRATWRREQIRLRMGSDPTAIKIEIRHHASIELAEKVIDDEERLYNVLAHEFCHLAVFMIDGVRNRPHGAEFKAWGRKAGVAFKHKGVEVTTKHTYEIEYKFVWECVECGLSFKRHSRSVDPKRHSCGRCKGRLVQIKPVPRGGNSSVKDGGRGGDGMGGANGEGKGKSAYQLFVKEHFARVKGNLEHQGKDAGMGSVMAMLGEEYRASKAVKEGKNGQGAEGVDTLGKALGGLHL